jgi:hypothetical protein
MTRTNGSLPVTLALGPQETPWSPASCLGYQKMMARSCNLSTLLLAFFAAFTFFLPDNLSSPVLRSASSALSSDVVPTLFC